MTFTLLLHNTLIPREESLSIARASPRSKSNSLEDNSSSSGIFKTISLWRHLTLLTSTAFSTDQKMQPIKQYSQ